MHLRFEPHVNKHSTAGRRYAGLRQRAIDGLRRRALAGWNSMNEPAGHIKRMNRCGRLEQTGRVVGANARCWNSAPVRANRAVIRTDGRELSLWVLITVHDAPRVQVPGGASAQTWAACGILTSCLTPRFSCV